MIAPNNRLTQDQSAKIVDLYDKISKSDDSKNHKLLTINTTIFAIVITLTSFDKTNKLLFNLYLATLILFVLSIISGYILTNTSGHLYRKALNRYVEHIVDVKIGEAQAENVVVSTSLFYSIISYLFEISTFMALISLATFTVVRQLL